MRRSWIPAATTAALLAVVVGSTQAHIDLIESTPTFTRVTTVSASASPAPTPRGFHSSVGLDIHLLPGWIATDRNDALNRRTYRLMLITNGVNVPVTDSGVIRYEDLDPRHVVLELTMVSFPGGPGAATESAFPLDWGAARPMPDAQGNTVLGLRIQHLLSPFTLFAHVGSTASAADRAAITNIVASIRPEAIPAAGVYRGWDVLGPVSSFAVGSVTHYDTPQSAAGSFYLVRGKNHFFAHIDRAYQFMGAMKPCPIEYDSNARVFSCALTGERWTRTGEQLTGGGLFGLASHYVFLKDGLVLIGGGSMSGGGIAPPDSDEFNDPVSLGPTIAPTKREILSRYEKITTTDTVRESAKLVSRDVALNSGVVRGAWIRSDISRVWVIAFSGTVRIQGFPEPHGSWTIFIADAVTGGVITAACCGDGEWPPGFETLPDLSAQ